jgi:hypothetical protein
MYGDEDAIETKAEAFGRWLLKQRDRRDWIDGVAEAARADRQFPRDGDPEAVRKRLREMSADGDAFAAIDDAELHWLAY